MTNEMLGRGRESFGRRAWGEAFAQLSAADRDAPLDPGDLERLATSAYLLGREADSAQVWERAYRELVHGGEPARAARCGFWLAFGLLNRGETARGAGWLAKAQRQLAEERRECAERGYLALPGAIQHVQTGNAADAVAISGEAADVGERCGDVDLVALARCVQGRALLRLGHTAEGLTLLDEVMVAVLADEVSPVVAGDVYCTVIEGCHEVFDLRRAGEWTAALTLWCEAQPDLVLYRGQCLVHRAEVMHVHGAWSDAAAAAQRAYERLAQPPGHPATGASCYLLAELHRVRGELPEAEEAYREAGRWGRQPQPGLALLRLAQGRADAAAATIRRAVGEAPERPTRPGLLAAAVEILLAAADQAGARASAEELSGIAAEVDVPLLHAMGAHAAGAVLLAEGDPEAALDPLRRAWRLWQGIESPYETARVRVSLGQACRAVGDEDGAQMEFDDAGRVFAQLGAAPDLARVAALSGRAPAAGAGGLTTREVEVLRLVAAGMSNRSIAAVLVLSEKTVARHVSNILSKLGLRSRSAATAHAYQRGLV